MSTQTEAIKVGDKVGDKVSAMHYGMKKTGVVNSMN